MSGVVESTVPNSLSMVPGALVERVVELPRASLDGAVPVADPDGVRRLAAVIAAFHADSADSAVLFGWQRTRRGGPVEILAAGPSLLPPASRTEPVPSANGLPFGALPAWSRLVAKHDGLLGDEQERSSPAPAAPSIEASLLTVWNEPFALVTLAEPVDQTEAHRLVEDVADRARQAKARAESSPGQAIEHDRLSARHRELHEGESWGLWRVRLLVGASDPVAARTLAGLVSASLDLSEVPYRLTPDSMTGSFAEVAAADEGTVAGSRLVTALTRAPTVEVPGVRLALPSEFDVTPETGVEPGDGLVLGSVLDRERRPAGELALPRASLNRHTFVCGATGAGKSQTVRHLLTEATRAGMPWLVVEPAKAEYRRMGARLRASGLDPSVVVIRPGDPAGIPAGIDPLRPQPGFALQTHLDLVRALFLAAFDTDEPFPQVLSAALTRCYEEQGWDVALGEPVHPEHTPRYPTLADLERAAMRVVEEIGYSREITDNVRGFVRVRLASLRLGTTGRFLEGGQQIDVGRLLSRNVVLEIEDVGDDRDKAFLIGVVLIALTEHHRVAQGRLDSSVSLRHLTVVEEAHRLLRRTDRPGPAAQAVEMFAALLAEIRAYGEGLVIAEQIPSKLIPDVIKNTAVKILHRLPALDDREAVGATMNLSDNQSRYVVTLEPGVAAAFTDGMDNPLLVRVPDGVELESAPTVFGSAAAVVSARSGRCGADYRLLGLRASDLAMASRPLSEHPLVRQWAELNVVAHLTGRPAIPASLRVLNGSTPAELLPAVALAVDDAVARRSAYLHDVIAPEVFAEHVASALVSMARGGTSCSGDEGWLIASPSRYAVALRLLDASPSAPLDGSRDWDRFLGMPVSGLPGAEQRRLLELALADVRATGRDALLLTGEPPFLPAEFGLEQTHPGWNPRLRQLCDQLSAPEWVYDCFATDES